ncbi:MAG: hypothetical protein G8345_17630, partial [Magnetococcales bacterium]|nr:hypothetical protein [Magnetococcales bacterium]NGZ28700.1 hypothetical protein [Magnetococcales bacterium]
MNGTREPEDFLQRARERREMTKDLSDSEAVDFILGCSGLASREDANVLLEILKDELLDINRAGILNYLQGKDVRVTLDWHKNKYMALSKAIEVLSETFQNNATDLLLECLGSIKFYDDPATVGQRYSTFSMVSRDEIEGAIANGDGEFLSKCICDMRSIR